ncbi:peptidyl-prolyl cis-trans isomerase CYP59-like [Trifolium pratense]|uniref:peptidyl-prolyl cis-trans isomerase CYP59-like n=1 Tax=Trifolium pratense TaxID=57577 RepID=UPI001E698078|nr:peptidyl-prolyl cis-trans isomerase CYP59-like [Trifolium pratense]
MDEQLNPGELEEVIRSKEAHSRAVVLESDEDLHTIFSRFGTVSLAKIIRDHKTGDNLCYAFIGQYVCPQSVLNLCSFKFMQEQFYSEIYAVLTSLNWPLIPLLHYSGPNYLYYSLFIYIFKL